MGKRGRIPETPQPRETFDVSPSFDAPVTLPYLIGLNPDLIRRAAGYLRLVAAGYPENGYALSDPAQWVAILQTSEELLAAMQLEIVGAEDAIPDPSALAGAIVVYPPGDVSAPGGSPPSAYVVQYHPKAGAGDDIDVDYQGGGEYPAEAATDADSLSTGVVTNSDGSKTGIINITTGAPRIAVQSGSPLAVDYIRDVNNYWVSRLTIPASSNTPIIVQPPTPPATPPNCCGGGGTYNPPTPPPPPPPPTPPPDIPPNPTAPHDTLFTCQLAYNNPGNTIAPNLIQVVENLVNIGGGINAAIDNIAATTSPPINKACDTPQAVILAIETERLINAGGFPNLNQSVFSRPITVLKSENGGLEYEFSPSPDGTDNYPNIPIPGFSSTDETFLQSHKYLVPVTSWNDVNNIIIDGSHVQIDNMNHPGLKVWVCGVRTIPSNEGLPLSAKEAYALCVVGGNTADTGKPFGSFYVTKATSGQLTSLDYASGEGVSASLCSRQGRTNVRVDFSRSFANPGTHVFSGITPLRVQLHDRFGGTPNSDPKWTIDHTVPNAATINASVDFDFSALVDADWAGVSSLVVSVGNSDESQAAGVVIHYYVQAYWS